MLLHDWVLLLLVVGLFAVVSWYANRNSGESWKDYSPPMP
jgi:hypothetical protein